jgi:signal transduction histidine kinase
MVAELERVNDHRRNLLGLVMSAGEEERQRIAVGIHDDSLQTVVAVGLRVAAFRRRVKDPEEIEALKQLSETVKLAAQRLRSLLFELRPPELHEQGLASTLRAYLEHMRRDGGPNFTLDDRLLSNPDPDSREFLYRVGKELLINARKHARASHVHVTLTTDEGLHAIRVRDDGTGFDVAEALQARPGHLGLAALTERVELAGGTLRIESALGAGATVEVVLPAAQAVAVSQGREASRAGEA